MSEVGIELLSADGEAPGVGGDGAGGSCDAAGVNGSFARSGYEEGLRVEESASWKLIDLTKTTWQYSGSMLLNVFPFHSFFHSLALLDSRNFISTMYLFALLVRMSLKCETSSLVFSPTKPKKSEGVMYEGTANMQSVVQSSSTKDPCAPSASSYSPGVSYPSRNRCTTPQPTSVFLGSEGMNLPLVARPLEVAACLRARVASALLLGSMSMLRMDIVSKRQSWWAAKRFWEAFRWLSAVGLPTGTGLS